MSEETEMDLDWMRGFPPPTDRRIRFADRSFGRWPQIRWSLNHMDELVPTKNVWRGPGPLRALDRALVPLENLTVDTVEGTLIFLDALGTTHTDGLLVLHQGKLAYERYFGLCGPHIRHITMSCNKSFVGTIAECLIHEGALDETALVPTILPELQSSAWSDASVRDVLDMRVGIGYDENYADPASDVWRFLQCTGMVPPEPGNEALSIADVLPTLAKSGEHGDAFTYQEPNIFVLGWLVRRAADASLAELVSEMIWQHIGAEHDAYYMLDPSGAETTSGATLRDFARFGQLIVDGGRVGQQQVIPTPVVERVLAGGDRAAFARAEMATMPGWSYRSQWWIRHDGVATAAVARGAYGQMLYIDPTNQLVIARFGSSPQPSSVLLDPILIPLIDAIVDHVAS